MAHPVLPHREPEQSQGPREPALDARSGPKEVEMSESLYIGIDVAKAQLDVACRPTRARWTVPHTTRG